MTWASSLAFTVTTMITGFAITPIILRYLGEERYGIARSLTDLLAYFTLIGQGVTLAVVPQLAAAAGRSDRPALARSLSAAFRLYTIATTIFLAAAIAFTPLLPRFIRVPPALTGELTRAWWYAIIGLPLNVLSLTRTLLDIAHCGYAANLLMAAQGVLTAVLSVVLARAGWGADGMVLALLIANVSFYGATSILAARLHRGLAGSVARARPDRDDWKTIRRLSGPILLTLLSSRIGVLSDSIVLAAVLGPAAATVLYVTQRLVSIGATLVTSISMSVWPSLAELYARGERETFNRRLTELTKLTVLLGFAAMGPVVAYNHHFLARWIGAQHDGGRAIVAFALANAVGLSLYALYNSALGITGHLRRLMLSALISALLNLALSVAFSMWLGPIGPLVGTFLAALLVESWFVPLQLRCAFGTSRRELLRAALVPLAWGVPFTALLCVIADSHTPAGWVGLLGEMGLAANAFLGLGVAVMLSPEERSLWNIRILQPLLRKLAGPVRAAS